MPLMDWRVGDVKGTLLFANPCTDLSTCVSGQDDVIDGFTSRHKESTEADFLVDRAD